MLNDIISAISERLYETFGAGYEVYKEQVKQGLKPPCLLITCVNSVYRPIIGAKYVMENLFSVVCFPGSNTAANAELLGVQGELFNALEYIEFGGTPLRGTGLGGQIVDGTLVFTINYNLFVHKPVEFEPMEKLEIPDVTLKG